MKDKNSFKRDFTLAALAALLAVPAFGATNANASVGINNIPSKYDDDFYGPAVHQDLKANGHHFQFSPSGNSVAKLDGINNPTDAQVKEALGEDLGKSATTSTQSSNTSNQYASSNDLPQTGENDGASKAMAIGAITLGASAGLMALSVAEKHRQEARLNSITTKNAVNDDEARNESTYHMIMSKAFKSISNNLKNA